jgi:hypothetical protein
LFAPLQVPKLVVLPPSATQRRTMLWWQGGISSIYKNAVFQICDPCRGIVTEHPKMLSLLCTVANMCSSHMQVLW